MDLTYPELPPRYDKALRAAVDWIVANLDPVGIIAAGTIIRGQPDTNSDLDIFVIHTQPRRKRIQRRFVGVPAEIFVNPPHVVRGYFTEEVARPSTAHMLVHGFVVLAQDPVVDALCREARAWLEKQPGLSPVSLAMRRYFAADTLENALDVGTRDPATATMILYDAVARMIEYTFLAADRPLPRTKEMLAQLETVDATVASYARQVYAAVDWPSRQAAALALAEQTIHATGFFEWETPWEDTPHEQTDTAAG